MQTFDPNAAATKESGLFGLSHSADDAKVIVIPVPFDATTSYRRGTAEGPRAILHASHQVDLFDVETGRPYEAGIHMLPIPKDIEDWNIVARQAADPIIEHGGSVSGSNDLLQSLQTVNQLSQKVNRWVFEHTHTYLEQGKLVAIVGGDHSVPFGSIKAHAQKYPGLGILHIDAHADLRIAYEGFTYSHASIMYNVLNEIPAISTLVQVGIRDFCEQEHTIISESHGRITLYDMPRLRNAMFEGRDFCSIAKEIIDSLPAQVYVSFDIDGLDPSLCPNTGTPVPGGLWFHEATYLLSTLARSGRQIVGFDINEVAPDPSMESEWDGNVASRLLYKLIGFSLLSSSNRA